VTYLLIGECISCPDNCFTCGSIGQCTSCLDWTDFNFLYNDECIYCPSECEACDSSSQCTSCYTDSGYDYYYNGTCLSECPKHTTAKKGTECEPTAFYKMLDWFSSLF